MDANPNKRLLQEACRANGIAYAAGASPTDLMQRLMHLQPPKKRKTAPSSSQPVKSTDVLSQDVFVASETARLADVFSDKEQLAEEVNSRWSEIRKAKLLDGDFFLAKDVDKDIIEQMKGEGWMAVLCESDGIHYRKNKETAISLRSQQDEEYAAALATDAKKESDMSDASKPKVLMDAPTDAPSTDASSSDSQKTLDAYAIQTMCRHRITEWILANGQLRAQHDLLGVHPDSALAKTSATRPRLLASKIAYSILPPDMELKSSLTLSERQKARPGEQWSDEEIVHLGHFAVQAAAPSSSVDSSGATKYPVPYRIPKVQNKDVQADDAAAKEVVAAIEDAAAAAPVADAPAADAPAADAPAADAPVADAPVADAPAADAPAPAV